MTKNFTETAGKTIGALLVAATIFTCGFFTAQTLEENKTLVPIYEKQVYEEQIIDYNIDETYENINANIEEIEQMLNYMNSLDLTLDDIKQIQQENK